MLDSVDHVLRVDRGRIGSWSAEDDIRVPVRRVEAIPTVCADQHIVTVRVIKVIRPWAAAKFVILVAACQHVLAGTSVKSILAQAAPQTVFALPAEHLVVASAAIHLVDPTAPIQDVVSTIAIQVVIATESTKHIVAGIPRTAHEIIRPIRSGKCASMRNGDGFER
jgi:hypothetical protein